MMKKLQAILIALTIAIIGFQLAGDNSYNCHDYAWRNGDAWLNDPTPYIDQATPCDASEATHIVYYLDGNPIHSGKVVSGGWIVSKWGSNPVVMHPVHVPGSGYGNTVLYFN